MKFLITSSLLLFVAVMVVSCAHATADKKTGFWDWFYSKTARTQTGRKVRRQAENLGIRKRNFNEKCIDIYDDFKESVNCTVTTIKNGARVVSNSISNGYQWIKSKFSPTPAPISIAEVP